MTSNEARRTPYAILLVASLVLTLRMGLRNSFGLFLNPMVADIGITSGVFGLSMAVQNLVWGITQPVLGAIADRIGTRPVLAASALLFALGILLMGVSTDPLLGLGLGGGILVGIGIAGTGFGTLMGAVARATPAKDGVGPSVSFPRLALWAPSRSHREPSIRSRPSVGGTPCWCSSWWPERWRCSRSS